MDLFYTLSGFLVGALVGVTGVGGGSLMTPLLVLVFGISPTVAVGTDLLYAGITKSGGVWMHARRGGVAWALVGRLASGSVPASLITLAAFHWLAFDPKQLSALMSTTLGFALVLTAVALLFKEKLLRWSRARRTTSARPAPWMVVAAGALLGALVTVSSVGAGALGVAALMLLSPGLAASRLVGTDIAHAVPLTLVAGLGHAAGGSVDWGLLGSLVVGSLPGIALGSSLSHKLPEPLLRKLLALMLALIGGRLAW